MGTRVRDLVDALKVYTQNFLGTEYHELSNVYSIESNPRLETTLGYGIIPEELSLTPGNMGFNTIDHVFTVVLTDYYISTSDTDLDKQDAVVRLLDRIQDLYNEYVETKLGICDTIIIINDMSTTIDELDDDKTVVARMSFNIKYRNRINK